MPRGFSVRQHPVSRAWRLVPTLATLVAASCQEVPTDALRLLTLDIEAPATTLEVGETLEFGVAAATPSGARLELVGLNWASSNPAVAEVEDGRVSGRLPGRTYIRAFIAGISDSLLITIRADSRQGLQPAVRAPDGCWETRGSPLGPTTMC